MSGVFEFGLRATSAVSNAPWMQQQKSGYTDSFFTGVLATAVATPCSAPFLAPALGAALAVPLLESFTIFTVIAIGLSTPYLLLSLFPQAVKVLPRPGAWMETFKQFMAFPLYATVGYLIWVLAAQTSEEGFRGLLFSLVLIAMAVWIYGRWNAPGASPGRARFGMIGLVVVGAFGLWLGWPREMQAGAGETRRGATGRVGAVEPGGRGETARRGTHDLRRLHRPLVRDLPDEQETGVRLGRPAEDLCRKESRHPARRLDEQGSAHHRRARRLPAFGRALQSDLETRSGGARDPAGTADPRHRARRAEVRGSSVSPRCFLRRSNSKAG
jgi:hypothetical protein